MSIQMQNVRIRGSLVIGCVLTLFSQFAFGQVEEAPAEPKTVKELLNQAMSWYEIYRNEKEEERLEAKPVLRWSNPIRKPAAVDGISAVIDYKSRPLVMMGIFPSGGDRVVHEFHLLAREPGVVGRIDNRVFWHPDESEVLRFRDIPKTKAPLKSKRLRMLQMKQISDRFKVRILDYDPSKSDKEALRKLSTAVHRYGSADSNTFDGSIYAFCIHGTDPEAFLLIEAYRDEEHQPYKWQFAFTKSTSAIMDAKLDGKPVWKTKRAPLYDPSKAWFGTYRAVDHADLPNK